MYHIEYQPFDSSTISEIFEFVNLHPWKPFWTEEYIQKFIKHLITSQDLVFDLFIHGKRIATAVLIDKVQNKGNNACLEILGIDQHYDIVQIYQSFIHRAKCKLPEKLTGIEITLHSSQTEIARLLNKEQFASYYDLFEMHCHLKTRPVLVNDHISLLTEDDFAACYEAIQLSFKDSPELAIPHYEDWLISQKNNRTWVFKEHNQIIGFINLILDRLKMIGDVSYIGVLPNQRRKGIGKKLLQFSLNYFRLMGMQSCLLTVAARNNSALALYQELGFEINEQFSVFRFQRSAE